MGEDQNSKEEALNRAAALYEEFMVAVGLPLTEETKDTPMRIARMFLEEFSPGNQPFPRLTKFQKEGYDQYVIQKDIQFSSLCEHHHMPFWGVVHVGYQPKHSVIGLSKIARIVNYYSRRPQLQERLVVDIADCITKELDPFGVIVIAEAEHSCMRCRGVFDPRAKTITSRVNVFPLNAIDKHEMLRLMGY